MENLQEIIDMWDGKYVNLFDSRIEDVKHKIEMYKSELKYWKEMKKIYLKSKK